MSSQDKDPSRSKTPTATIKIAAKEASKRTSNGGADPGPGDLSAEPSMMPEPVNVPRPPTNSELVVKSDSSRAIKTINDPVSLPKSSKSSASTMLSGRKTGASAGASGPTGASAAAPSGSAGIGASGGGGASGASGGSRSDSKGGIASGAEIQGSQAAFEGSDKGIKESARTAESAGIAASRTEKTASTGTQTDNQSGVSAGGGQEHDEEEEGEGEVEQGPSPGVDGGAGPSGTAPTSPDAGSDQPSGGVDSAPASSGGGTSKMSPKTSAMSKKSGHDSRRASSASSASSQASGYKHGHAHGHGKKKKKKVTKFRYHKRITVRTHGKTSPSTIMHKVNQKDQKAGITPSTIETMDTDELMRRAGIKGNKKTHWRVRLRQTKRLTSGGKTVTQTKIAYRDSKGNKRVKTSLSPYCKTCGRKLEDCKCEEDK